MLKSFVGSGSWKYKWVLALGLLASGGASAVTITGVPCNATDGCWEIGVALTSPFEIPQGTWIKNLAGATVPTGVFDKTLTEHLVLTQASGLSLSDWTETIVTAIAGDWIWDSGTFEVFGCTLCGGPYAGTITNGGATITFGPFAPVIDPNADADGIPGGVLNGDLEIDIVKKLHCAVALGTGKERCPDPFSVVENKAPEPGTLLLLAGGLAGLAGLRRRRYA